MKDKILAIIPARSGSKGLPDKNIKLLHGKPLMAYTIEAARQAGVFHTIMVSTDSEEYAAVAREYGAEVPFLRSAETASDQATTRETVLEVLERYKESGKQFEMICILQPTSPMRTEKDIEEAVITYKKKKAKAIISVCETDHPPLWMNTLPEDNSLAGFLTDEGNKPRQLLANYYRINGAIYLYDTAFYLQSENPYQKGCYAYIMDKQNSVDIDDQLDFSFAEMMQQLQMMK